MDTEVGGNLLERHTVFTILSDANNVVAELLGVGLGHNNILPGQPRRASQIRCHLLAHQPPLLVYGLSGIASPSAHATDPDARPHVPENWQWGSGTVDMVLQNRHSLPHVDDDTCRPSERLNRPGFVRGSQVPRRRVP